jgi:hypothetical protein
LRSDSRWEGDALPHRPLSGSHGTSMHQGG